MISNELLEEIIYVSLKNKFINERILRKVFDEVYEQLDSYTKNKFKSFIFAKIAKRKEARAICKPRKGIIVFDLQGTYEDEMDTKDNLSMLKHNLNIILTLLHEVEHLKEPAKLLKNNFESKLLKYSDIFDMDLQLEFYYCNPSEKIANANSRDILLRNLTMYPNFCDLYFDEYRFINNEYIRNIKSGYFYDEYDESYNVPLIEFLRGTKQIKGLLQIGNLRNINSSNNKKYKFDLETHMKYGLPITKEDMEDLNKLKILTKSTK